MSDTDLDLELAGIDDGGNNKPPVHFDPDRNAWVYRASAISSCSRQLQLIRTGVEPAPPPPDMLRRFRDGHLHERSILAEIQLQRPGWKVNPVDPYSGEQYEVEVWVKEPTDTTPGIVIVGHIDGLAVNPLHNPDSRICEAKAFSKDNFATATKAVEQGRFWDAYPYYRDQMTVYMAALEVPTFFAIKNKDNGEVFVFDVPEPPGSIDAIMAKVRVVDARAGRGMVEETCDKRSFPCFAAGTLVMTPDGYRAIEHIEEGDLVLTHQGRWREVTETSTSVKQLRSVTARGSQLITTDNHPFLTRTTEERRDYKHPATPTSTALRWREFSDPEWTFAEDLSTEDHLVGSILPPVDDRHDEFGIPLWRLAGRWVADGWFSSAKYANGQRAPIISCGHHKTDEMERMAKDSGLGVGISVERTATKYRFHQSLFTEMMNRLDFGEKAHAKRIPGELLTAPVEVAQAFMEGYLSGDGYKTPTGWRATTVSEELAYGLSFLYLRTFGTVAGVSRYERSLTSVIEGRVVNQRPSFDVFMGGGRGAWTLEDGTCWRRVQSSDRLEQMDTVYDITVDEDQSFIANGLMVHNCPTFRHCNHGDGATPSLEDDPAAFLAGAFGETGNADLDDLCDQYVTARDAEKKAGELKKNLQAKIAEVLGETPSMDSERFKVSWKTHTYRFLDEEAMRLDGIELEEYRRERQSEYPDVRVKKGKKK